MRRLVRESSKITAKGQTTVPKVVRQALGVSYGGTITYVVDEGDVRLLAAAEEETDPVLDGFLAFLARDMARDPSTIAAFPADLAARMKALSAGLDMDEDGIDGPVTL